MTLDIEKITTSCYTFEVTMIIQIVANSEEEATIRLNESGGYSSKRDVSLKKVIEIHSEDVETTSKKGKGY
jgi:hypothetical protein